MSIKLYQFETCPYCRRVRETLRKMGLSYEKIEVPLDRAERKELLKISGQYKVPVLKDGDKVIVDSERIIAYLNETY